MSDKIESLENIVKHITEELTSLRHTIGDGLKKVESNFDVLVKKVDGTNKKVDINSNKIDLLSNKLDGLDTSTTDGLSEVGVKLESLTEEIQKISVVTKYTEEYDNLKGLN